MNTKKPFLYALGAVVYIVVLVLSMSTFSSYLPAEDNILMPMAGLSLLVLSVAIMGFLFLSEPLRLFLEGQKREAFVFFGKTVGIFACFLFIFTILMFFV